MVTGKKILVAGAGGFIGGHLIKRLSTSNEIVATDVKSLNKWFQVHNVSNFPKFDCRDKSNFEKVKSQYDIIINLACDHGGVGYLTNNDYRCLTDVTINLNLLDFAVDTKSLSFMFASSACVYNKSLQDDCSSVVYLAESDAWPAWPDMKYGLEKLYSEELCLATQQQHNIKMFIPRIHGCYGPYNHYNDIKEKAPNALMRKALFDDVIEVWGDGTQKRSFMYVDDVVDGIIRLLESDYHQPINIGSDQVVTLSEVADIAKDVANRDIPVVYLPGTVGVASRCSDNTLVKQILSWEPTIDLVTGLTKTAGWLREQI